MKKIMLLIMVVVIAGLAFIIQQSFLSSKVVSGEVYDCITKQRISNAIVLAAQQGWGWDGYLVWDKSYPASTKTDASGKYLLEFQHGDSANLIVSQTNYRTALQWEYPRADVAVGLLPGDSTKNSYNCIPEEECMTTRQDGDVTVGWNKCTDPEPKPYK